MCELKPPNRLFGQDMFSGEVFANMSYRQSCISYHFAFSDHENIHLLVLLA